MALEKKWQKGGRLAAQKFTSLSIMTPLSLNIFVNEKFYIHQYSSAIISKSFDHHTPYVNQRLQLGIILR